ncbi:SH3 domain-containing protein [Desulfurispira natronophila]|uniref:Uncharacterized protein YraI n=1 Tax=Desulfurispira natronophila TaxID=682562 RepID=A0A7W8DGC8_9BACT|nr:SH3 domain-containing protein [Desulfurispira natronophila]MBB5021272.1 uncharacterized protein YraI [Desulfurispira natronophila]
MKPQILAASLALVASLTVNPVAAETFDATTSAHMLNVRSGPGTNHSIVGVIRQGDRVQVQGAHTATSGNTWYRVHLEDASGYASGRYIEPLEESKLGQMATVTPHYLNMRSAPSANAAVVDVLPRGTRLEVVQQRAVNGAPQPWLEVSRSDGRSGFVYAAYVNVEKSAAAMAPEKPTVAEAPAPAADSTVITTQEQGATLAPINPRQRVRLLVLADQAYTEGRLHESMEHYETIAWSEEAPRQALVNLLYLYGRFHYHHRAEEVLQQYPDHTSALAYAYGAGYLEDGRPPLGDLEEMLLSYRDNDRHGTVHFLLGFLYERHTQHEQALAYYRSAYLRDRSNGHFAYAYARSSELTGTYQRAHSLYAEVLQYGDQDLHHHARSRMQVLAQIY